MFRALWAVGVVAVLAGCEQCKTTKAPDAPVMPAVEQKEPAKPVEAPAKVETLVTYGRSGGVAGLQQALTVSTDGAMSLKNRDGSVLSGQAEASKLARLKELLGSDDLGKVPTSAKASGADLMTYTVTLPDGRGFLTMDAAENPPALNEILAVLNELLGACRTPQTAR